MVEKALGTEYPLPGTVVVVDDFEDGDISEYGGDTSPFGVQTSVVSNGSNALELTGVTDSSVIADTGDLSPPSPGDTFYADVRTSTAASGNAGLLWATQNEGDNTNISCYFAWANYASGSFGLYRSDSGSATSLQTASQSYTSGAWNTIGIEWPTDPANDPIVATLYDEDGNQLNQVSAPDDTYTSGGVGWRGNQGSSGDSKFFDYYRIGGSP